MHNAIFATKGHYIQRCTSFLNLTEDRIEKVKQQRLCINCLRADHSYKRFGKIAENVMEGIVHYCILTRKNLIKPVISSNSTDTAGIDYCIMLIVQ